MATNQQRYLDQFQGAINSWHDARLSRRALLGRTAAVAGGAALAMTIPAMPRARVSAQDFTSDVDVLNYALTLEWLEFTFYRDAFELFGPGDFAAGVYDNIAVLRDHEGEHVDVLIDVINSLGGTPVGQAQYDFGYGNDPNVFIQTAAAVENLGVSAYNGAAQFIQAPELVTAAGTIVAIEARHASYLNLVTGQVPFPSAFETPFTAEEVLSIAGPFIVG